MILTLLHLPGFILTSLICLLENDNSRFGGHNHYYPNKNNKSSIKSCNMIKNLCIAGLIPEKIKNKNKKTNTKIKKGML